jgi:peptidyl-tRNA hydrolase, PTH1 family
LPLPGYLACLMDNNLVSDSNSFAFLIAGLGNPGRDYRDTRHNIGFLLIDRLAERLKIKTVRMEMKAIVRKTNYDNQRLILAKPQTFMNLSGQSVGSLFRYYKVTIDHLLIVYDDIDLPLGSIRLRPGGGAGGQKGMLSIINVLGTESFPRLRLGIGRPPGRMEAANYVLHDFPQDERELLVSTLDRAVDAVFTFVTLGLDAAMNRFN